jgi:hypothetical protein
MSSTHGIPGLTLRTLESYVERLAAIEPNAESDKLPMLAYPVHLAIMEAQLQVTRARAAAEERKARPPSSGGLGGRP